MEMTLKSFLFYICFISLYYYLVMEVIKFALEQKCNIFAMIYSFDFAIL